MSAPARKARAATARAVLYLRQSQEKEESISLEDQEHAAREYCRRNGYRVVEVITDRDLSGRRWDNRTGVQRCLAMIEDGEANTLVLWRWSRLARNRRHFAMACEYVEQELGGSIEAALEPVDTSTASGRLQRGMHGEFAAYQSDMIGETWREAQENRIRRGLPPHGKRRYGYIWHRGPGVPEHYEPDPDQADIVRWMYKSYIAGQSFTVVTRELNAHGVTNARGRPWYGQTVTKYLDSGFAAGRIVEGVAASIRDRSTYEGYTYHPGAHEPIIDEDTWLSYLEARYARAGLGGWSTRPTRPLTGLVVCGDCSGPMNYRSPSANNKHISYACIRWYQGVGGASRPCHVQEWRILDQVFAFLYELANDVGQVAESAREAEAVQLRVHTDADQARRELADIDQQLANLTRHLASGVIEERDYYNVKGDLGREREQIEQRLKAAEREQPRSKPPARQVAAGLLDEWDTLPVAERRTLLSRVIARIVVTPTEQQRYHYTAISIDPAWSDS